MTKQELIIRKQYCINNRLCFVSLTPLIDGFVKLIKHSIVDIVLVNEKYIKVVSSK